jgi:hypothetical protein
VNFLEGDYLINIAAVTTFSAPASTKMATSQDILHVIDQAVHEYNRTNASSTIHSVRGSNFISFNLATLISVLCSFSICDGKFSVLLSNDWFYMQCENNWQSIENAWLH